MPEPVTPEWLDDFGGRIFDLATEAELRFGDPGPCQYPSEVEMLLHMAHNAARRKAAQRRASARNAPVDVLCHCRRTCGDDGDIDGPGTCKDLPMAHEPLVELTTVSRGASRETEAPK